MRNKDKTKTTFLPANFFPLDATSLPHPWPPDFLSHQVMKAKWGMRDCHQSITVPFCCPLLLTLLPCSSMGPLNQLQDKPAPALCPPWAAVWISAPVWALTQATEEFVPVLGLPVSPFPFSLSMTLQEVKDCWICRIISHAFPSLTGKKKKKETEGKKKTSGIRDQCVLLRMLQEKQKRRWHCYDLQEHKKLLEWRKK